MPLLLMGFHPSKCSIHCHLLPSNNSNANVLHSAIHLLLVSVQDLEVQNNELVKGNQKLQKELSVLRTLAKEAIMEKKKSQTALETLKHQVVHLLGQHDMVTQQELAKQREGERQQPPAPASTGDLCSSNLAAELFSRQNLS